MKIKIMKITGITAEYNPLHKGHVYQMRQAREKSGCDAVAVAMSGDYVQRGEPAVLDKWTRCGLALDSGADLVVEIPVQFCLGNASQYASASVCMLEALGCGSIAFGSESGDAGLLKDIAGFLAASEREITERIAVLTKEGLSYPAARTEAFRDLRGTEDPERLSRELAALSDPNDILAIEYIRHMRRAEPLCVRRLGAGHSDGFDPAAGLQSAGAVRQMLRSGRDISEAAPYLPECTVKALRDEKLTFQDDWTGLLKYAALMTSAEQAEDCPSAGEGLGNLIKQLPGVPGGWDDAVKTLKSRRYTYTRISRLFMQLILGIRRSVYGAGSPRYIRVLGFNERGREILADLKDRESGGIPVITNINREARGLTGEAADMLDLDVKAADIYNLVSGRGSEYSDHIRRPVIK